MDCIPRKVAREKKMVDGNVCLYKSSFITNIITGIIIIIIIIFPSSSSHHHHHHHHLPIIIIINASSSPCTCTIITVDQHHHQTCASIKMGDHPSNYIMTQHFPMTEICARGGNGWERETARRQDGKTGRRDGNDEMGDTRWNRTWRREIGDSRENVGRPRDKSIGIER